MTHGDHREQDSRQTFNITSAQFLPHKTNVFLPKCSFCGLIAAACCTVPISLAGRGWEDAKARAWTLGEVFIVSRLGIFMGLGNLSCHRNVSGWSFWNWRSLLACCDWLGACVISYHAFGPLSDGLGQFCLLFVSLHALASACTIALPHPSWFWTWYLSQLVKQTNMVG